MKFNISLYIALVGFMLTACSSEDKQDAPVLDTELTVSGISDAKWTYISLENNAVVGTSDKDDSDADSQWAKRTDWDIAICGDMVRTNSGTSGAGQGGIRRIDGKHYDAVTAADAATVDADRPQTPAAPRE